MSWNDFDADQARRLSEEANKLSPEAVKRNLAMSVENMARQGHYQAVLAIADRGFTAEQRQEILRHFHDRGFGISIAAGAPGGRNYYSVTWEDGQRDDALSMSASVPH